MIEIERAIDFAHHIARTRVFRANHDTIRTFEVVDRCTLAQEFGVRHNREISIGRGFADQALDFIASANRNR